jgi:hypothetical protein
MGNFKRALTIAGLTVVSIAASAGIAFAGRL